MNKSNLCQQFGYFFNTDDGGLPEIEIKNLSKKEGKNIFLSLFESGGKLSDNQRIWVKDSEINCEDFEDLSSLYDALLEPSQHVIVEKIQVGASTIPPIGVFAFENEIELNYKMGKEWNENSIYALFDFFKIVKKIAPNCVIEWSKDGSGPFHASDIETINIAIKKFLVGQN